MRRFLICLTAFLILPLLSAYSQITQNYQWTEIEKPYWANSIDVAFGHGGQDLLAWHRYLIGSDESSKKIFWWDPNHEPWNESQPLSAPNRIISYRNEFRDYGDFGFCTDYGNQIYRTQTGGLNWGYVPGSEALGNKQFSTIEINYNASTSEEAYNECFVGCKVLSGQPSVYKRTLVDDVWQWNTVGQGLGTVDVNDLEYDPENDWLFAGTSDGLYGIHDNDPDWSPLQFSDLPVPCVEGTEYHQTFWAATGGNPSQRKLFYTDDNWQTAQEIQIPGGQSFNKEVNDIAAIPLNNLSDNYQSVYIATKTGLYLFNTVGMETPLVTDYIDFQECPSEIKSPFASDFDILSLDFYQSSRQATTRKILVGTTNGVYLLTETRINDNKDIDDITCEDITEGTFPLMSTSGAHPVNTGDPQFFVNSDKGIIKEYDGTDWSLKGLAFEADQDRQVGTDVSSDFVGAGSDYLLASAKDASNGTVMFSSDAGQHWIKVTPGSEEIINTVDLDRLPDSDTAWAAGTTNYIWKSTDNGLTWNSTIYFGNPSFNDILSDPSASLSSSVYACGSGIRSTYSIDGGRSWSTLENGLGSVTSLYQLGRESTAPGLYAATDLGFYKIYDIASTPTWSVRDYGIPTSGLGSVVVDPNNPYALLASTSPDVSTPHIWASGDSGRSWIDLPLDVIPSNARIYKLVASQDANSGFVALTDKGVFAIGDIFKSGDMYSSETWGPGVIIVNGDLNIASSATLNIIGPCTIYMVYDFDYTSSGYDHSKCEIRLYGAADLIAHGDSENRIIFTSSKPTGKAKGDWTGITTNNQGGYPVIDLEYVTVEYADNGVFTAVGALADRIEIDHCDFNEMTTAGIDLYVPGYLEETPINNCNFINCGSYGIRIRDDSSPAYPEITISGNYMENCDYGVWYSGNSNASHQRTLKLTDNTITMTAPSTQSQYGIYITRHSVAGPMPVVDVDGNTVLNYRQGGIWLNYTDSYTSITQSHVYLCGIYGLRFSFASASVMGQDYSAYNSFDSCYYGMHFDESSTGTVRWTRLKGNTGYGAYIASHDASSAQLPDFGRDLTGQWGYNAIHTSGSPTYWNMYNASNSMYVDAQHCWWYPTLAHVRNVNIRPTLLSNPLPNNLPKLNMEPSNLPVAVNLEQNYPNPFNPTTQLSFGLPGASHVSLSIYNITGQLVKTLVSDNLQAGEHHFVWNGRNANGEDVTSGVYFYVLSTDFGRVSKVMTLLR